MNCNRGCASTDSRSLDRFHMASTRASECRACPLNRVSQKSSDRLPSRYRLTFKMSRRTREESFAYLYFPPAAAPRTAGTRRVRACDRCMFRSLSTRSSLLLALLHSTVIADITCLVECRMYTTFLVVIYCAR